MLPKLLAWLSFATALLFAALALAGLFGGEALGGMGPTLVLWVGTPLLVLSILLSVALLILSAFQ